MCVSVCVFNQRCRLHNAADCDLSLFTLGIKWLIWWFKENDTWSIGKWSKSSVWFTGASRHNGTIYWAHQSQTAYNNNNNKLIINRKIWSSSWRNEKWNYVLSKFIGEKIKYCKILFLSYIIITLLLFFYLL